MVDFSNREEFKRWLDAIEPAQRRREVAVVLAARAVLRVVPLISEELTDSQQDPRVSMVATVLPTLRATAFSWASGKYPPPGDERRAASAAAMAAALTAYNVAAYAPLVAYAARLAAGVANAGDAATGYATDAVADAAIMAASAASAAGNATSSGLVAVDAYAADAEAIDSGRSGAELAGMPLWPNGAPGWASDAWRTLKSALLAADQGWEVWTDWYEARLAGDAVYPPNDALEVARVTIPEEIWKQGPAVVNAEIKRLTDKFDPPRDQPTERLGDRAVAFSNRKDVQRWLDKIEPAQRRREAAVALAARAALRVLPLAGNKLTYSASARSTTTRALVSPAVVLPTFGAAALAWTAGRYPSSASALRSNYAPVAARRAEDAIGASGPTSSSHAVTAAAFAADTVHVVDVLGNTVQALDSAFDAAATSATVAHTVVTATDMNTATEADAALIDSGRSAAELAGTPLWPKGAPGWAAEAWLSLKAALLAGGEDWDVWTDWYEARLAGDTAHPPIEALEVARATIAGAIWRQGPAVVNADIKRLIAAHLNLQQRPAAFQFQVVGDKIDALPESARPIDVEDARDFYDEAKRKGQELKDRLQRAQADENIRAHVDLLLVRLGSSYADLRPGLVLSVLRSLESDVRAYDGEEGRRELSAAQLSSMVDLAESVRDLCAVFPRSREIEAEAVSLGLPMQRLPEIRQTIDSVVAKVNHSDGATEGGREAINASAADLAHQRGLADEAKQSAYFLVDFANFARAGVKHLKATGRAIGGELGGLSADGWRAFRRGAPRGIERGAAQAGKALVVGGVAALMHWLGSDIAALGAMVGPYLPLHEMLEKMTGAAPSAPASEPDQRSASSEAADEAPPPPASKSRKPKARKPEKK